MLEEGIIRVDEKVLETYFVCRNFQEGDRVNVEFKGKFYRGVIIQKESQKFGAPFILIKTDEKVGEADHLLGGYGLRCHPYGRDSTFFEDEPLPEGDFLYKRIIQRQLTKKEIKKLEKEYDSIPF